MRVSLAVSAFLVLAGPVAPAFAADAGCDAALASVTQKWQAAGFSTPAKPSQAYVAGRGGRQVSATDVAFMRAQINQAAYDCRNGQSNQALERLSVVDRRLTATDTTQLAGKPTR